MLKHVDSLCSLFWLREVAIKSCSQPRTHSSTKNEECAEAGALSAPCGSERKEVSSELANIRSQDALARVDMKGIFQAVRRVPSWSTW